MAVRKVSDANSLDHAYLGRAHDLYSKVLLSMKNFASAARSAHTAARAFRKTGDDGQRGHALLIAAEADCKSGYFRGARANIDEAIGLFEKLGDKHGESKAYDILDSCNAKQGLP